MQKIMIEISLNDKNKADKKKKTINNSNDKQFLLALLVQCLKTHKINV